MKGTDKSNKEAFHGISYRTLSASTITSGWQTARDGKGSTICSLPHVASRPFSVTSSLGVLSSHSHPPAANLASFFFFFSFSFLVGWIVGFRTKQICWPPRGQNGRYWSGHDGTAFTGPRDVRRRPGTELREEHGAAFRL